jgi:exopolysaccharide biosynthesis polyprenyl glycosylphosphotransferase
MTGLLTSAVGASPESMPRAARIPAGWGQRYGRILVLCDLLVILAVLALAAALDQPLDAVPLAPGGIHRDWGTVGFFAAVWMTALTITGSRSPRYIGNGVMEYRRVTHSTFLVFGVSGLVAYVLKLQGIEQFLAVALGAGLVGLVGERWIARRWLSARRRAGEYSDRVLLVGSVDSIAATVRDLARAPEAGLRVVGACTASGTPTGTVPGTTIPVMGSLDNVIDTLAAVDADTVIITNASELSPERVRKLSWELEPGRQHLIVAPSLTDVGGPRLHTRPVAGLPLIHVETPKYKGGRLYGKRIFDVIVSGALIIALAPVLLAIAVIVRLTTPGPVIFRQDRIGLRGRRFSMLKFRSMYVNAESRLVELVNTNRSEGNVVMFKMKGDPRVTPIGRILRRFSIDELPQLFNVFRGTMSIVGPRPPLEHEVDQYAQHVHRRFLVKPGITGLWQVSGRSDLDWDETVRLDLYYVENWTMTGDLVILWKTVRAVIRSDGAY